MRTLIVTGFVLLTVYSTVQSQQLPLFTQYRENQSILNPAALNIDYITSEYNFSFGISSRDQWSQTNLKLSGDNKVRFGPWTGTARFEWITPLNLFVGGYIMSDKAGAIEYTGVYLRLGYILDLSEDLHLATALSLGRNQFRLEFAQDLLFDYAVQFSEVGTIEPFKENYWDQSLGVFAWYEFSPAGLEGDFLYAGLSFPQMRGLPLDQMNSVQSEDDLDPESYLRYNVLAGVYKYISEETFLEGSLMFTKLIPPDNVVKTPSKITLNSRFHFQDKFWLGVGSSIPFSGNRDFNTDTKFGDLVSARENREYSEVILLGEFGVNVTKWVAPGLQDMNFKLGFGYERAVGGLLADLGSTWEVNFTYTVDLQTARR